jgi:hypothetical protein
MMQSTDAHITAPRNFFDFMRARPASLAEAANLFGEHQAAEELVSAESEYFPFPILRLRSVSSESLPGPKINMSRPTNRKINGSAP